MTPTPTPHPTPATPVGGAVHHAVEQVLTQPPSPGTVLAAGILAVGAALVLWPVAGILVTMAHEGAHALFALVLGGRVLGVTLHRNATGLTLSQGAVLGLPVTAAGYLGPPLFGLTGSVMVAHGYPKAVLWISIGLLALLFLTRLNLFARLVVVLVGAGLFLVAQRGSDAVQALVATAWVWLLLIGGVVQVLEDGPGAGDFRNLRRRTFVVPATVWAGFALLVAAVALVAGGAIMLGMVAPSI